MTRTKVTIKRPGTPRRLRTRSRSSDRSSRSQVRPKPHPKKNKPKVKAEYKFGVGPGNALALMEKGAEAYYHGQFEAMSKYLYGFVDPDNAGRGPPSDTCPTVLASYRLTYDFTVSPYAASWTPWVATTDTPVPNIANAHMLSANGSLGIAICPLFDNTRRAVGGRPPGCLGAGYTFDPDVMTWTGNGWRTGSNGYAKPFPLPNFPEAPPTLSTPDDTSNSIFAVPVPHRIVGLRSTLITTSPALVAQGDCYAGDNRDFYVDSPTFTLTTAGARILEDERSEAKILQYPFSTYSRTIGSVGQLSPGCEYEACWLPGNDNALTYDGVDQDMSYVNDNGTIAVSNTPFMGQSLMNRPYNIFVLRGLNTTTMMSFRLSTVCTVEIPVTTACSLALFLKNARLSMNFQPAWAALACLNAGGTAGAGVRMMSGQSEGRAGIQMALAGITAPATRPPLFTLQGPSNATEAAVSNSHLNSVGSTAVRKDVSGYAAAGQFVSDGIVKYGPSVVAALSKLVLM